MSPLEAVRRLSETEPIDGIQCAYCGAWRGDADAPHNPDCLWLAMSGVVAVLEAARDLIGTINWDANEPWVIEAAQRWEARMDDASTPSDSPLDSHLPNVRH